MNDNIIRLHRLTGLGVSECKKAYEGCGEDLEKAYTWLREKWNGVWRTADK